MSGLMLSNDALSAIASADISGDRLALVGQLDRKVYLEVARALDALGGKWSRKERAHVFIGAVDDIISDVLLTGVVSRKKQNLGQFFTPYEMAEYVVSLANLREGLRVLEPSAGHGALASIAALEGCVVDCVEIDPINVEILRKSPYNTVIEADFLSLEATPTYDRVIMNPPFAKGAEVKHVLHALGFLRPGGELVVIMSAGVTFRTDKQYAELRETLARYSARLEPLPTGTFRASGTDVNTVVVSLVNGASS